MSQEQDEIDRLRARVAELEKQPHANELRALRDLFAAAGRTIHTASSGGRATLEEINDAWAEVCAAKVVNRDLPAPDVVTVPREDDRFQLGDGSYLVAINFPPSGCVECELKSGCSDGKGMRCTPRERSDSRRIVWVHPSRALRSGEGGKERE